jgi:hypothetical protein
LTEALGKQKGSSGLEVFSSGRPADLGSQNIAKTCLSMCLFQLSFSLSLKLLYEGLHIYILLGQVIYDIYNSSGGRNLSLLGYSGMKPSP